MNLLVFFVIWAIIWFIPFPPKKFRITSKRRWLIFGVGLFLFGLNVVALTPLSIFVYFLFFSRTFAALFEYLILPKVTYTGRFKTEPNTQGTPEVQPKLKHKKRFYGLLLGAILVFSLIGFITYGEIQRIANASYFNGLISQSSGLPFESTPPDAIVRLVTKELAYSIARRHMSEFGSNTQVLDCHITKSPEGKLVWVVPVGSTNIIAENYIKGFVIVDATEPTAAPKIVQTEFNIGKGLWWDRSIDFRNYLNDITNVYGVAYPTWDLESSNLVYVATRYDLGFDLVNRYETPLVYNAQGDLQFEPLDINSIPTWTTQIYDEDWLEYMINEMGGLRRGSGFDYFAGGFLWVIAPSRERFQMTEDTRYIVDPQTGDLVALLCVNPVENQRSLSGVFKATQEGIFFYDFKLSNYISGMTAEDLVEGRLPKPATGNYYATMPLLYSVETVADQQRLAWYVPIYWNEGTGEEDETIYLAGFAIVDAQDTNKIALTLNEQGITSEQLVKQTRIQYINLFGGNIPSNTEISAEVLNRYEYVQDGSTHIVLRLDSTTYPWVEATPNDLSTTEWNQLLSTRSGQTIQMQIENRNDKWVMTTFSITAP